MKNRALIFIFLLFFHFHQSLSAQSNWSLLIYADPCTEITEAVLKNLIELAQAYTTDEVQVYIQLQLFLDQDPSRSYAWRYTIHHQSLELVDTIIMDNDPVINITNAMQWAYSQQDSLYHGIIFSGHGSGVLEPVYNEEFEYFEFEYDDSVCSHNCPFSTENHQNRSILMNALNGTAINNEMMIEIMSFGTTLIDKKIDFIGFDLCLGSCIEHAYQLAPYANYFVGCQNNALIDGFDFYQLGIKIQEKDCTPHALSCHLVSSYQDYYENVIPDRTYTLSALKLDLIEDLTQAFNLLIDNLMSIMIENCEMIDPMIAVRKNSFHVCVVPMYIDMYDFIEKIQEEVIPQLSDEHKEELLSLIKNVLCKIKQTVIHHVHGSHASQAHGLNIYYPYNIIEESYFRTKFAQNTNWINYLMFMTQNYVEENSY